MDTIKEAFRMFGGVVNASLQEALIGGVPVAERRSIFSSAVVIWLMIFQRLSSDHSLEKALEELRSGQLDELLSTGSLPARVRRISGGTGGYARARERLGLCVVERTADRINEALEQSHRRTTHLGFRVYVVDGSTIRVAYTPENVETYSQYKNQHGKAHFPLLRVGVATNALTGVALRPEYGPYNGDNAVGELQLAENLLQRIPAGSVVIGDRYFGSCRFADMAQRAGLEIIARVKDGDAKKFIGVAPSSSGELAVTWTSSRSRTGNTYSVVGRFIWHTLRRKGFRSKKLILFTTMDLPRQKIVELYALRWNVELDLRDMKSTLDMDMLYSKTPAMGAKELILGITAYNLVKHIAFVSAKTLNVSPRSLSFSRVLKRVHAVGGAIYNSTSSAHSLRALTSLFSHPQSLKLPNRKRKRPQEPRKIWRKGETNFMSHSREKERAALNNTNQSNLITEK